MISYQCLWTIHTACRDKDCTCDRPFCHNWKRPQILPHNKMIEVVAPSVPLTTAITIQDDQTPQIIKKPNPDTLDAYFN